MAPSYDSDPFEYLRQRASGRKLSYAVNGAGAVPSFDPDAEALFERFTTEADVDRKTLINDTIVAMKDAGIWAKLDALYILAAHDAQAARQNWKANAFNLMSVNSPTFTTDRGCEGDGASSYINTDFDPSISGGQYAQDSNHAGVWVGTNISHASQTEFGYSHASIASRNSGNAAIRNSSTSSDNYPLPEPTSIGWLCASRNNPAEYIVQKDLTAPVTFTRASSALANLPFYLLARSAAGPTAVGYSARRLQAAHWGSALDDTERAALYTALLTYFQSIGAA